MRNSLKTLAPVAAAGVLTCGLATSFAGPAAAATPAQDGPSHSAVRTGAAGSTTPPTDPRAVERAHHIRHHGGHPLGHLPWGTHHRSRKHRHGGGHGGSLLGSSTGVHLYNNSVDKLVLTYVEGSNEGVPPIGSVLSSGVGYQDFEVTFRAARSTSVWAYYDVYDPTDTRIGTAVIQLSNDAMGDTSVNGTFTNDQTPLPLMTAKHGSDFQVQGNSSATITVDASSPTAIALTNEYCNTTNTDAKCTYTPTSRIAGTQMHLLAEQYSIPGGGNTDATVSVASGYSASTSTSWSVTVTAQMELADVFTAGISSTYGQSVSLQHTFTAGDSISVSPGYTGYIWGNSPVINYSGTMQLKLGNTTYDIVKAGLATPDPSRSLSDFNAGTWQGNDPLDSPDQPPAKTTPLP